MAEIETTIDQWLFAWQDRQLRLWLTPLKDRPETFGQWAGLVRLCAEDLTSRWQPQRPELLNRIQSGNPSCEPREVLLPMAADALEAALLQKGVPGDVARRARDLLTLDPPVAQWMI